MMMDIPYNIIIMNHQGIIVGSGKKERVGTVHQGAVKALSTGQMVEVLEDGLYEKKDQRTDCHRQHPRWCDRNFREP